MATITVDVDLDQFDDDEILDEAEDRGLLGGGETASGLGSQREAMLRALWDHDEKRAIELLKTYLCDVLGRAAI